MREQASGPGTAKLERAIVLELLADEDERGRSRAELAEALDATGREIEEAVRRLHDVGILRASADVVAAAPGVLHLDELGLIGI